MKRDKITIANKGYYIIVRQGNHFTVERIRSVSDYRVGVGEGRCHVGKYDVVFMSHSAAETQQKFLAVRAAEALHAQTREAAYRTLQKTVLELFGKENE